MVLLRVKEGPCSGMVFKIEKDNVVLGRDSDCEVPISDQGVSRHHAEVYRIGEMYFIRDLGSRNGSFVNDEEVKEAMLRNGDRIRIGGTVLVFEDIPADAQTSLPQEVVYSSSIDPGSTIEFKVSALDLVADMEEPEERFQPSSIHSRYLSALYKMAKTIGTERDEKSLLDKTAQMAAEAVGADDCYILLKTDGEKELSLEAAFQLRPSKSPLLSRTIIKPVIDYGRAVLTPNVSQDERFKDKASLVMGKVTTIMCVPVVSSEQTIGVIYLSSRQTNKSFNNEDLELMVAVGIQLGAAIFALRAGRRQRESMLGLVRVLVEAVDMREPHLAGYSEKVAEAAFAIGEVMKLSEEEKESLLLAGLLHNIGWLGISKKELEEAARAEQDEQRIEYKLALGAERILKRAPGLEKITPIIKHSYELYDGSGLPNHLKGEEIPLGARILAVARQYAIVTKRGNVRDAFMHLNQLTQSGWLDSVPVKALAVAYRQGKLGSSS
ncbi:MAG: FHA domain-containing protein [Planctomycetota bacterium]|nr:FHA domain-containing protein [Planctomycetota bacterium]